jgi:hypothetical protein
MEQNSDKLRIPKPLTPWIGASHSAMLEVLRREYWQRAVNLDFLVDEGVR